MDESYIGREISCSSCGNKMVVPAPFVNSAQPTAAQPQQAPQVPMQQFVVMQQSQGSNGMAVTGFVFGLMSILFSWTCCLLLLLPFLGLIFSGIGLVQVGRPGNMQSGKGLAVAGLVLSLISVAIYILAMIFVGGMGLLGSMAGA